ncbi:MAG: hypothetical protein ACPGU6_06950 [Tenacibaculum sp.]
MQLTKEQIQRIEAYLNIKQVHYIDVRIEILDHMILDIENLLLQEYSFEDALKITISKWNKNLDTTSSIYLGHAYVKPKPIIEKLKGTMKKHAIIMWVIFIISMIAMALFKLEIKLPNSNFYDALAKSVLYASSVILLIIYFLIYKTKQKTSYRFLYESQVLPIVIFSFLFGTTMLDFNGSIEFLKVMMVAYGITAIPFGIKLYKKHLFAVKQYTLKCN